MSIEGSSAVVSAKAPAGAANPSGKGKAASADEADALAVGGFLALLTSLGPDVAAVDAAGAGGDKTGDEGDAVAARLSSEETPQLPALPVLAPLVPTAPAMPSDLALPVPSSLVPLVPTAPAMPGDLAMLLEQAGQVAGNKSNALREQQPAGAKGSVPLITTGIGVEKPELLVVASPLVATAASPDVGRIGDALLEQVAQGVHARTLKTRGAERQSGAGAIQAEVRALSQSAVAEVVAREPALSAALLSSGLGDSVLRPGDRTTLKASFSASGSGVEGVWGPQAFQPGGRFDTPAVVAGSPAQSLESIVADKVSYWVTQGVQNAALKLEGFGDAPLEVSISLKRGEAHVDFRTDQPEIRQILEGAVIHLKELLKSEGLVLSGVSVGTSGHDGAGAQERRNRPDARQASISTIEPTPAQSQQRVSQSTGRAVDIFV